MSRNGWSQPSGVEGHICQIIYEVHSDQSTMVKKCIKVGLVEVFEVDEYPSS